jgi:AraC-like DNA-binding protein
MHSIPSNGGSLPQVPGMIAGHYFFLTPSRIEQIDGLLTECMLTQKPYLTAGYGIRHLAKGLNIPAYQLSAFINQRLGMKFNDFFNRYRVRYCLQIIEMGMASDLNMRGLAQQCGFSNRNTFSIAFKKFAGVSPSRLIRSYYNKAWYWKANA